MTPHQRNTRWVWSAIDPQSKLWLGFLIADRSLEAAQVFIHRVSQLLARGCVPLFLSDRWKPYAIAILTHFGHWVDISSEYGRRRLPRWIPLPGLAYAQVVKRRIKRRLVHVSHKVVYGSKEGVKEEIKQTIGNVINTSFVERMNLTLRHHVPALARRTIQIANTNSIISLCIRMCALRDRNVPPIVLGKELISDRRDFPVPCFMHR